MYRSQEIIQIFHKFNCPDEITKYILSLEREWLFEKSCLQWLHLSHLIKMEKCKRFFYEESNDLFLQQIRDLQGSRDIQESFEILKKNKERIRIIRRNNRNYGNGLRSLRY